jgi:hypothetical protein
MGTQKKKPSKKQPKKTAGLPKLTFPFQTISAEGERLSNCDSEEEARTEIKNYLMDGGMNPDIVYLAEVRIIKKFERTQSPIKETDLVKMVK